MSEPLLVIISGAPGTGKTTLGRRIAAELRFPFIGKDDIKERLFDTLGVGDRAWSRKLGIATYPLLYYFVETQISVGRSLVVESNFRPELSTAEFLDLKNRYAFEPFQILCQTEPDVLLERFKRRSLSGERHPGHVDHLNYEEFEATVLQNQHDVLPIGGTVIRLDTTDFARVDYQALFEALRSAASGR